MSIFNLFIVPQSLFTLLLLSISMSSFSGGVADSRHEAKKHISAKSLESYQLSLDDVLPSSSSILIRPSTENVEPSHEPILIRVTGYGAFEDKEDAKSEPKRLMALRSSKLDAYRALAERVYGLSIKGRSLVKNFAVKEDSFVVGLDSYVRGARVVSVIEKAGRGYETVLELSLPGNFDDCLNKVNNFKNGLNCLRPLPNTSLFLSEDDHSTAYQPKPISERYQGSGYFLN